MPRHWTREEDELLQQMIDDGMTCREMADNLPRRTMSGVKSRINKTWKQQLGKKALTNPDALTAVMGAVRQGHNNCRKIAEAVGRDKSLVSRWVREFERDGLLIRKGKGKNTRFITSSKWPANRVPTQDEIRLRPPTGKRGQRDPNRT